MDSVTKRHSRPKSGKRQDYTARTMAGIKQHSEAEKLSESQKGAAKKGVSSVHLFHGNAPPRDETHSKAPQPMTAPTLQH